jgi:pilus assembly protein CpaB
MTIRRLILALFVALTISGLFTYLLSRRVGNAHVSSTTQQYVAAGKPIEAGEILKASDLRFVAWPASVSLQGAFAKPEDISGRLVLYPMAAGQPILERDLAAAGSGTGLSARIPDGMRAISLKSDEVVGVAGFLLPGTHVDVLETSHTNEAGHSDTFTVLQDVVVLAAGPNFEPDPTGKASSVNVVTLLLKPEDAEKIVLASSEGAIHFVLRNGADRGRVANIQAVRPIEVKQVRSHEKATAAKSQTYLVETVMGDKKVINSFN